MIKHGMIEENTTPKETQDNNDLEDHLIKRAADKVTSIEKKANESKPKAETGNDN